VTTAAVAVVGGGITGLAAARALAERGVEVVLLEAGPRMGGKIVTETLGDLVVEGGPDSFLARDPAARLLCEAVGLGRDLVAPASFGAVIWSRGRLRRLPPGWPHGLPVSPWTAWRAGLLSPLGAARAAADLVLPGSLRGADVSVGAFIRRRFGRPTLEQLVDPLLAGTRAGDTGELSLAAALPTIDSLARRRRSVILGLREARRSGSLPAGPPPFLSVRGGLGRLVEHLVDDLEGRARLLLGARVTHIEAARGGFALRLDEGETIAAEGVVVAVPAYRASSVLASLSAPAAAGLAAIEHASVAVVTLLYPPGSFDPPAGTSGMLVPSSEGRTLSACSWFSEKWPHAAPAGGEVVLRCFVGRSRRHPALSLPDDQLTERIAAELADALELESSPRSVSVARWDKGLPQYAVGHLERLREIEAALAKWPRVQLAGASYRGSGLPDCIRQGEAAAGRVLQAS
jgi:oxygen-dependent protoporphyrinogen oxidase